MRFRKRPIVIEAVQFTGSNHGEIARFEGLRYRTGFEGKVLIETLEGVMTADAGDWIIRGVKGEYYPCKPDIFEATYEPAE